MLNQEYNEKCDIWSCGVILFVMLCGYPPFTGKRDTEIYEKIRQGKLEFNRNLLGIRFPLGKDWMLVSNEAIDLLKQMLTVDFTKRISAREALLSSWVTRYSHKNDVSLLSLANLQRFTAKSVFQKTFMSFMAAQLSNEIELNELRKTFLKLDTNIDGFLSREELVGGYASLLIDRTEAENQVDAILQQVDINMSGQVDFTGELNSTES